MSLEKEEREDSRRESRRRTLDGVLGPAPSDTPGWKQREGSQMQTLKPQPGTKEKAITEYTKALRKTLLNEGC